MSEDELSVQQRATAWLEDKWPEPRTCPICRQNPNWVVYGPVAPVSFGEGVVVATYTSVMLVTCSNCAHAVPFNAVQMGIVERRDDDA